MEVVFLVTVADKSVTLSIVIPSGTVNVVLPFSYTPFNSSVIEVVPPVEPPGVPPVPPLGNLLPSSESPVWSSLDFTTSPFKWISPLDWLSI